MRRWGWLFAVLALLSWAGVGAWAGEGEPREPAGPRPPAERPRAPADLPRPPMPMLGEYARLIEPAGLTDEQKGKVAELAQAQMKEIQEIRAKYAAQVLALLTPEQKAKAVQAAVMGRLQPLLQRAKLTDEQRGKLHAFISEQGKDLSPMDDRAITELVRKVHEFLMNTVLTDEQKAALRAPVGEMKRPAPEGERRPPVPWGEKRPAPTEGERRPESAR